MKLILMTTMLLVSTAMVAQEHAHGTKATSPAWERMKALNGDWESKEGDAIFRINYKLISSGSALMETVYLSQDNVMVTMYAPDGGKIVMTHYCDSGNQPRLRADGAKADQVAFNFIDATNLSDSKAEHMRDMKMRFIDDDHIVEEWTSRKQGVSQTSKFELTRVKSAS